MKFVQGIPSFQGEIPSPSRKEGQSKIQEYIDTKGVEERQSGAISPFGSGRVVLSSVKPNTFQQRIASMENRLTVSHRRTSNDAEYAFG
jgi:hypothetical protein